MRYLFLGAFCLGTLLVPLFADKYIVDSHGCVTVVGSKFSTQRQEKFNKQSKYKLNDR